MFSKLRGDRIQLDCDVWGTHVDAAGKNGIRCEVKILVCMRILGRGRSFEDANDSIQMGRLTIRI